MSLHLVSAPRTRLGVCVTPSRPLPRPPSRTQPIALDAGPRAAPAAYICLGGFASPSRTLGRFECFIISLPGRLCLNLQAPSRYRLLISLAGKARGSLLSRRCSAYSSTVSDSNAEATPSSEELLVRRAGLPRWARGTNRSPQRGAAARLAWQRGFEGNQARQDLRLHNETHRYGPTLGHAPDVRFRVTLLDGTHM